MSRFLSPLPDHVLECLAQEIAEKSPFTRYVYGVRPWAARVYVEARAAGLQGIAVVRAIGRANYGLDYPLFDHDPIWLDAERRTWSRTFHCIQLFKACESLRLGIPRQELAA